MSRLTPIGGFLAAALFLAAGAWWLANMTLQASGGFAAAPMVSAQAAVALVLGQWLLIALFAGQPGSTGTLSTSAASGLSYIVPVWPLIALLWLCSDLSVVTLVATQAIAFTLALAMAWIGAGVERMRIDAELEIMLRSAIGIVVAAAIWTGRSQLHAWVTA